MWILGEKIIKISFKKAKIWTQETDIGEGLKEYEDNAVVYHIAKQIPLEKLNEELMDKIDEVYQKIN